MKWKVQFQDVAGIANLYHLWYHTNAICKRWNQSKFVFVNYLRTVSGCGASSHAREEAHAASLALMEMFHLPLVAWTTYLQ